MTQDKVENKLELTADVTKFQSTDKSWSISRTGEVERAI